MKLLRVNNNIDSRNQETVSLSSSDPEASRQKKAAYGLFLFQPITTDLQPFPICSSVKFVTATRTNKRQWFKTGSGGSGRSLRSSSAARRLGSRGLTALISLSRECGKMRGE